MDRLFEIGERVLKGELSLEELKAFSVELKERLPFTETFRRSALIVSGDKLKHLRKSFTRDADVLIFNLEDGVAEKNKDFARTFLKKFLTGISFDGSKEVVVRINGMDTPYFWEDIFEILPVVPHAVRLSKVTSFREVVALDKILEAFERSFSLTVGTIGIHLSIETGSAIENLEEILGASSRIKVAYLGMLDLFSDINLSQEKLPTSPLSSYIKSKFVLTCKSLRVVPIGPAYQDFENLEGFEKEALEEREIGFEGKMCISVRQVEVANRVFSPSEEEIKEAEEIVKLYEKALEEGKGGVVYKGKFIDQPIYKDALNKLKLMKKSP